MSVGKILPMSITRFLISVPYLVPNLVYGNIWRIAVNILTASKSGSERRGKVQIIKIIIISNISPANYASYREINLTVIIAAYSLERSHRRQRVA